MAVHMSATHVLQRLVDIVSPAELTLITSTLFPAGVALTNEAKGVFAMLRCLDQLGLRCTEGPVRERAMMLADGLCGLFLESPQQASVCVTLGVAFSARELGGGGMSAADSVWHLALL